MKKIKSREEFVVESEKVAFDALHEDEMIDIEIKLEDKPDTVIRSMETMNGVKVGEVLPFGVIKAKAPKKMISAIENIDGVEDVDVEKKAQKTIDKM